MAVTIADVAHRAGTSTAVVSYVLNDGPRPVAATTRDRVLAAIDELGYRPNRPAASLRSGTTGLTGLVVPDTVNPYFATLARHLEAALDAAGTLAVMVNTGYDPARQATAVERLLTARVDGIVLVSADGADDPSAAAHEAGTPLVAVHHRPVGGLAPLVAADNDAAVRAAVSHLHEHGHNEIDFLAGPADDGPVAIRTAAWRATTNGRLWRCAYDRSAATRLVGELATGARLPRALLVATDEQAVGVLAGAAAHGVGIPHDLAVASCDGSPDTAFTVPPLTVTEQPFADMAADAVEQLGVAGGRPQPAQRARLVVRHSCGCPELAQSRRRVRSP